MLGIACSKFRVTFSPASCAEAGAAIAMAKAADAAPITVRIFMALVLWDLLSRLLRVPQPFASPGSESANASLDMSASRQKRTYAPQQNDVRHTVIVALS